MEKGWLGIEDRVVIVTGERPEYELNEESCDKMFDINVKGMFLCAQACARGRKPDEPSTDYNKVIPLGRDGKLDEVGSLVAFLVSDRAGYITGTTVNISGGKSRG